MIDITTGGIQAPDESNELNAWREIDEELGIKVPLEDLKLLGQVKYDGKGRCWGNVFLIKLPDEGRNLTLQKEEVKAVIYLTKEQILQKIEEGKELTYDSKAAFEGFLKFTQ